MVNPGTAVRAALDGVTAESAKASIEAQYSGGATTDREALQHDIRGILDVYHHARPARGIVNCGSRCTYQGQPVKTSNQYVLFACAGNCYSVWPLGVEQS